ncbi:MAG: extracellular solute-binding protein [Oscillospiraceae bacterium]|nr:extracellular solute-binding protein [Oscillospiraceae bacterium]
MDKLKKIIAGISALTIMTGLTACGGDTEEAAAGETTTEATTTTAVTVEINTETLNSEEANAVADVTDLLPDVELENKTIKWFSFYDPFHATTAGNTKALSLELFEKKYGGEIEYIETTWNNRFNDLSTKILGGEGIDFIAGGDLDSFPKGVTNGMFQPVDDYIDYDSELWSPVKELNDKFFLNGNHYLIATQATPGQVVIYNKQTIEENGFEDPADLLAAGEWDWNAFKEMLLTFVDPDAECYGLDGWFNEQPLMLTSGVPSVELKDGLLVHNIYDPDLERSMDFMYSLSQNGLVLDKNLFGWNTHIEYIGEGKELFYICGIYTLEGAPEIWTATYGDPEDVMFVPMPKDPDADEYYLPAGLEAFMMCKGAQNPEGVVRFMECILAANQDERTQEIAVDKLKKDYGWTDEMIEMKNTVAELTAANPVYDIHSGCPTDMYNLLDGSEMGIRAAFYGHDWPSVRDSLVEAVAYMVDEFNATLQNPEAAPAAE